MLLTFFLAVIGWIIFRAESIGQAWEYLQGMMQYETLCVGWRFFTLSKLWPTNMFIVLMIVVEWLQREKKHGLAIQNAKKRKWLRILFYYVLCALIIQYFGAEQTFIYFQF